ncbi:MAG: hypothetical protein R2834_16000 [Rhodothermales bacterium]
MNNQTTQLIEQLKDKLVKASDELIIRIIQEARDEALVEAKAMLKERMLQAILESAAEDQAPAPASAKNNAKPQTSGGTWFQPQPSM